MNDQSTRQGARAVITDEKHVAALRELRVGIELDAPHDPSAQAKLEAIDAALEATQAWRPVVGFDGVYEVSWVGDVRKADGTIIGQWSNADGYSLARLSGNGKRTIVRVHRLVADAFVPNPNQLPYVNHIDNDRANNIASNLEWCTQAQNLAHMTAQGRRSSPWLGKRSPSANLSEETVAAIRAEYKKGGVSHQDLADWFAVSKRTVGRILTGKSYLHATPAAHQDTTKDSDQTPEPDDAAELDHLLWDRDRHD